jgi:hypothetical protein
MGNCFLKEISFSDNGSLMESQNIATELNELGLHQE